MKVTILGCGSSGGVPLINGHWGDCDPLDPRNHRRRSGILIEHDSHYLLIDTTPDLREQLLDARTPTIDAVLYTHAHADHIHGLEELRPFWYDRQKPIPVYGHRETLEEIQRTFNYAFQASHEFYQPFVEAHSIEDPFELFGLAITPIQQDHVVMTSWGYRIGDMAYSTDFKTISPDELNKLRDLDLWIVDCLRYEEHPTHSHFDGTLALIHEVRPKKAILIHMNHQLDYQALLKQCPPGVEPAYDGMVIEL